MLAMLAFGIECHEQGKLLGKILATFVKRVGRRRFCCLLYEGRTVSRRRSWRFDWVRNCWDRWSDSIHSNRLNCGMVYFCSDWSYRIKIASISVCRDCRWRSCRVYCCYHRALGCWNLVHVNYSQTRIPPTPYQIPLALNPFIPHAASAGWTRLAISAPRSRSTTAMSCWLCRSSQNWAPLPK